MTNRKPKHYNKKYFFQKNVDICASENKLSYQKMLFLAAVSLI